MIAMKASLAGLVIVLPLSIGAGVLTESTIHADAAAEQPSENLDVRVAALIANLRKSREAMKQYEWIETTTVFLRGEQKAEIEKRCYYGADGKVEKVLLTQPAPAERSADCGIIAEKKKSEMTDEMKQAVETLHQYVPPDHEQIQKCKDAGNASFDMLEPGKLVRLNFKDYRVPGDKLSIEVDLVVNRPKTLSVSSFIESPAKPLNCDVQFGTLEDGSTYAEQTTLKLEKQDIKVVVENSGYRKQP